MTVTNETVTPTTSKVSRWAGVGLTTLTGLALIFSGVMKVSASSFIVEEFNRLGWPDSIVVGIGILELVCALLYLIPQTSVLGAILLTGYLGGAVATHVRLPENFASPIVIGVLAWLGLYLREPRLRAILPFRN